MEDQIVYVDIKRFSLIQLGRNKYVAQKMCSISNEVYKIYLTTWEFLMYYRKKGKNTRHLKALSLEQKLFLRTTCTPLEVSSLTEKQRRSVRKKSWRHLVGQKDK